MEDSACQAPTTPNADTNVTQMPKTKTKPSNWEKDKRALLMKNEMMKKFAKGDRRVPNEWQTH
jgi:hypothetical protein